MNLQTHKAPLENGEGALVVHVRNICGVKNRSPDHFRHNTSAKCRTLFSYIHAPCAPYAPLANTTTKAKEGFAIQCGVRSLIILISTHKRGCMWSGVRISPLGKSLEFFASRAKMSAACKCGKMHTT